jgi:hypothetical protein
MRTVNSSLKSNHFVLTPDLGECHLVSPHGIAKTPAKTDLSLYLQDGVYGWCVYCVIDDEDNSVATTISPVENLADPDHMLVVPRKGFNAPQYIQGELINPEYPDLYPMPCKICPYTGAILTGRYGPLPVIEGTRATINVLSDEAESCALSARGRGVFIDKFGLYTRTLTQTLSLPSLS